MVSCHKSRILLHILIIIVLLPAVTFSQARKGDFRLSGVVVDENEIPVASARVVAVNEVKLRMVQEARTDNQGKWTIPFVKKGNWSLCAFTNSKMSSLVHVLVNRNRTDVKLVVDRTTTSVLIDAKTAIYREDYNQAIQILEWFNKYFASSRQIDNALFWLGHSLNKKSDTLSDRAEKRKIKIDAIKPLDILIGSQPNSEWADDAKVLRIEIAVGLIKLGLNEYENIIQAGLDSRDPFELDVKLAALDALVQIDKDKAMNILSDLIREYPDAGVRKKAIFIIGQFKNQRVQNLLTETADKDPDKTVRKAARFWLNQ